jgi:PKD repeat protein
MRKLYALLTGFALALSALHSSALPPTPDVANFTFTVDHANKNVVFTNTSVIGSEPGSRLAFWSFGDGTSAWTLPLQGTQHHYQLPGIYNVCLKIYRFPPTSPTPVVTSTICKTISINVVCRADFEKLPIAASANPLVVTYKALPWINNNKKPVRICWIFGDGRDTCINYPSSYTGPYTVTHRYNHPGLYNVCVKIRYEGGCEATKCKEIRVAEPDRCTADFERVPLTVNNPLRVGFKALPHHNNNKKPKRICWQFGDGQDTCINYSETYTGPYTVAHTYNHPGNYNVCVKIFYYGGCEATKCREVRVPPGDRCEADFERLPPSAVNMLRVGFKAIPHHNNNKKPKRICWEFGDGRDTCITYPENYTGLYTVHHTYAHPGNYNVCVKILYYGGCEATKCKEIHIPGPDQCTADFERVPLTASSPLRVGFKALPHHNNNKKPKRICWRFGDGQDTCINYPENYTGQYTVAHNYSHPGTYEVCVKIIYYGGCEAEKCKPVQVPPGETCSADFQRLPVAANPLRAVYKPILQHSNNKKPFKICWRFGDGEDTCINYPENYTGQYLVEHTYNHPGNYEVCVKIFYYGGCIAEKCRMVAIPGPDQCTADFERLPPTTAHPLMVHFKALPQHNNNKKPSKICWRFGDGEDTCINYPENYTGQYTVGHRYNHPGNYEVCVKIFYYGGCEATKCKMILVPPVQCSVRLFEIIPSVTSLVRGFVAVPSSSPPARPIRICWYFGDGEDTCIVLDPAHPLPNLVIRHTYPAPGRYRACVKILFQGGCIAEDCTEVMIRRASNVCGGFMVDSLVSPRTFKFKGFSIHVPNDEVIGYRWTFGDGTTAAGQEVTHTYAQGGNYEVCLFIKTRLGCETKICKPLRVPGHNAPQLHLSPNPVINVLNVMFFSTHTEPVTIRILNNSGVQVRSFVRNVTVGTNNWTHELANLVPGMYSYVVQSPNQLASAIFIKQ